MIGCDCRICSSADPRDTRLRTSVLVQYKNINVVIDAGPDFRQQMLKVGIKHLNAVLLTHEHKDHISGLDDVRAFNRLMGVDMPVFCEDRVFKTLKNEFAYAFAERKYPGVPGFDIHKIEPRVAFKVGELEIMPVRCYHHKLPVLGFRMGGFVYLTDLNNIADDEWAGIKNCDVVVIDALRYEKHISHYSLSEALEVIDKVQPKKAYLTHISHGLNLHSELLKELPVNVEPGYDGLEIITEYYG